MKKDIKKSSYYVWFLGAEEAKGLRGREFMVPVVRHLVEREKEVEPFKVTLQVSHKGLKIVQNVPAAVALAAFGPTNAFSKNANAATTVSPSLTAAVTTNSTKNGSKTEAIKHFIPHQAITSVYQEGDLVSCILLLFNPITKCPVHVHVYRCDSIETAEILCGQLQTLLDRPENRKKLDDIESRLRAKGLVQQRNSSSAASSSLSSSSSSSSAISGSSSTGGISKPLRKMTSNGASSTRDSDLSVGSSGSDKINVFGANSREPRITNLYDSLAAELKEKLCTSTAHQNHAPILLPPRDYDTVHRQKGNLFGIDLRRCLNMNIVGVNAATSNAKNRVNVAKLAGDDDKLRRRSTPEVCADNKPSSPPPIHMHANFAQQQVSAPIAAGAAGSQTKIGSSGESSGIGSDHAPSPDHEGNQFLDNQSTSDEEWNFRPSPDTIFLMQNTNDWHSKDLSLPRARRRNSNSGGGGGQHDPSDMSSQDQHLIRNTSSSPAINSVTPSNEFERRQKYLDELRAVPKLHKSGFFDENSPKREQKVLSNRSSSSSSTSIPAAAVLASASSPVTSTATAAACKKRCPEERQRSSTPTKTETTSVSPKERFKDAKEKFQLLERERLEEREKILRQNLEKRRAQELAAVVAAAATAANKHPQRSSSHSRRIQDDERDFDTKIARPFANESDQGKPIARSPYHYRNKSTENLRRDSDEYDPTCTDYSANVGGRKRYQQYYASNENVDNGKLVVPSFSSKHQHSFYKDETGTDSATGIGSSRYDDDNRQFYAGRDRRSVAEISASSAAAPFYPRSHRPETARSFSENCLPAGNSIESTRQYDREYNYCRPRDMASVQHSVSPNFTVAVGDESIPLRRYCSTNTANNPSSPRLIEGYSRMLPSSPPPTSSSTNTNSTHFAYPYHGDDDTAVADEAGQLHQRERRIKRSESKYRSTANNNMEKRRSTASNDCCASTEDEKRRNSNEIAKELKRNFYQDHRIAAEPSYQHAGTTNGANSGYHETANNFDRYASNSINEDCQEMWSSPHRGKLINKNTRNYKGFANGIPTPSPPPPPISSPRYRHSYAEPFHHQSSPPIQQYNRSHDILQRRNSSLSSGRVGIAAVHRY